MRRAFCLLGQVFLLAGQAPPDGQIQRFAAGYNFVSALAWSRDGSLLVADSGAKRIIRIDGKGPSVLRENTAARGLATDAKGVLYICDDSARTVVRTQGNKSDVIADLWQGKRFNGPRHVVVTKNGYVFFTDPAFASADQKRDLPFYGIFRVSPKGDLTAVAELRTRANGLALSMDHSVLYATLADDRSVVVWSVDRNGATSGQRTLITGIRGVPDGIAVGPDGNVYVAARDVEVYTPAGAHITTHQFAGKPTSIAFGEGDLHTMFVGTGGSVFRMRLRSPEKGAHH
jgi:gluconolactonase